MVCLEVQHNKLLKWQKMCPHHPQVHAKASLLMILSRIVVRLVRSDFLVDKLLRLRGISFPRDLVCGLLRSYQYYSVRPALGRHCSLVDHRPMPPS